MTRYHPHYIEYSSSSEKRETTVIPYLAGVFQIGFGNASQKGVEVNLVSNATVIRGSVEFGAARWPITLYIPMFISDLVKMPHFSYLLPCISQGLPCL